MKIFLISNMYPSNEHPDYGVFVKNFKTSLENLGVEFPQSCLLAGRNNGIRKIQAYFSHYLRILKTFIKSDFDLIYVHYISHNAPILCIILWVFKKKTPIVVNVHGSDVMTYNFGFFRFLNTQLLKKTDLVVVPSKYFSNQVFQKFPFLDKEKVFVNPSGGIDLDKFYVSKTQNEKQTLTLGFVSRIDEGKGWDSFISVVSQLNKDNINVNGIMVGTGSQVRQMQTQIEEEKISSKINYVGVVNQKELVHLYNQMDIFIFPSTREAESLGLVGLEAMACGVPIIASNKAGAKTYTNHEENGYLSEPGSINDIIQKVINFRNLNKAEKDNMKRNAIDTAMNYSKESTAKKMQIRLKELVSK